MTQLPSISFASLASEPKATTVVYFADEGGELPVHLKKLDAICGGAIAKAIQVSAFKRRRKNSIEILAPHGLAAGRLLIVGTGDPKTLNAREWLDIGGAVRGKLPKAGEADIVFTGIETLTAEAPVAFALGFSLRSYAFKKYKSKAAAKEGDSRGARRERRASA